MSKNKERLVKLADRAAIMLLSYWSKSDNPQDLPFAPFDDPLFWTSADADELRAMPEYQDAIEIIRGMI